MSQHTLFEAPNQDRGRLESETLPDSLSRIRDTERIRRLAKTVDRLWTADALDAAKLALEARDVIDAFLEHAITDANRGGRSWRDLGAELGVPYQSLHRRYGAHR